MGNYFRGLGRDAFNRQQTRSWRHETEYAGGWMGIAEKKGCDGNVLMLRCIDADVIFSFFLGGITTAVARALFLFFSFSLSFFLLGCRVVVIVAESGKWWSFGGVRRWVCALGRGFGTGACSHFCSVFVCLLVFFYGVLFLWSLVLLAVCICCRS